MAETIIPLRSTERTNEIVRRLWLKSSTDRPKDKAAYYRIRVGIATGSYVDWLGEWNQSRSGIGANEKFHLSGEFPLNIQLDEGTEIVVGITSYGSPATLYGMSVEVKGARAGSVGEQNVVRRDGDFPPGAEIVEPLFGVNAHITDGPTREAVNAIIDGLNNSGALDWSHSHALTDAT